MIKYPIGIHTFEGIRREQYVYVDKTELIYRLRHGDNHYLLYRPRMFGKSLLLSTIQSYFKAEKEIFSGLMISDLEKSWPAHAVLKFDFQDPSLGREDALEKMVDTQLVQLEQLYGHQPSETTLKDRFLGVIERAYQTTGRGVVILIDNYDSPMLATMEEKSIQGRYIDILTQFYSVLPMALDKIRFSLICGITAIGKSSFLKDYVYSVGSHARSCKLKSHYKTLNSNGDNALVQDPQTNKTLSKSIENEAVVHGISSDKVSSSSNVCPSKNVSDGIDTDSPLECPLIHELPSDSSANVPLLPQTDECHPSGGELVNEDNSITATNADSRFALTTSADFIPMDADPSVKVIVEPEQMHAHLDERSEGKNLEPGTVQDIKSSAVLGGKEVVSKTAESSNTTASIGKTIVTIGDTKATIGGSTDHYAMADDSRAETPTPNTDNEINKHTVSSNRGDCVSQEGSSAQDLAVGGTAFIRDISLDSAFTGLCGFSEDEILDNMRAGLERLAQYKESDVQSVMEAFSRRYYGYHFNIKGHGRFNPYDVFNALSQDRIGDYWCTVMKESSLNDLVISKMMMTDFDMRLLKECRIPKSELERDPFKDDSPIPLLYQFGYLTIMGHGPQDRLYYLTLANKEVREEFLATVLDCYGCFRQDKNNYITAMLEDLQNGFPEIFVVRMKSFFQDPDYAGYCRYYAQTSALKMTNFQLYCQNILYLVFTLLSKDVLESFGQEIGYQINDGNAELIMQFDHIVYIFQFVLDQDINCALHLIQERHLQAPVTYEDKQIIKVCVSISSELRNISSWFVEKDDSPQYQSDGDQESAFPLFLPHNF